MGKKCICRHMKVPCKSSRASGAPPRTNALIGPAACGRRPKPDNLKRHAVCALPLLNLLTLWNSSKLRFPLSQLRHPTRAGPLDRAKAVTSQSNAWKPTCEDEQSFPRRSTNWPRDTRTESTHWTHAENETKTSILLKPTKASNKLSIPNSDWTGKILIWMQKRKPRHLSGSFSG